MKKVQKTPANKTIYHKDNSFENQTSSKNALKYIMPEAELFLTLVHEGGTKEATTDP